MCGRFAQITPLEKLWMDFQIEEASDSYMLNYNCAPTQQVGALLNDNKRKLLMFKWGLDAPWNADHRYSLINVRSDSFENKKYFRELGEKHRCIVIADGFYEWKHNGKDKQPYFIRLKTHHAFALAGLYTVNAEGIYSCAIITTHVNQDLSFIHDRMPVILKPEAYGKWLNTSESKLSDVLSLLQPYPDGELECYPVSHKVNSARAMGAELILPYNEKPAEDSLF